MWANWDVEELKAREAEIRETDVLTLGLDGWPFESALKPKKKVESGGLLATIRRFSCVSI